MWRMRGNGRDVKIKWKGNWEPPAPLSPFFLQNLFLVDVYFMAVKWMQGGHMYSDYMLTPKAIITPNYTMPTQTNFLEH